MPRRIYRESGEATGVGEGKRWNGGISMTLSSRRRSAADKQIQDLRKTLPVNCSCYFASLISGLQVTMRDYSFMWISGFLS